jgi:hypothetical protein
MATFLLAFVLQCYFPIFLADAAQFLGLSIANTDAQPRDYAVTVRNPDGAQAQEARFSLAAGAQRAFVLPEVITAPHTNGWIQVDSGASGCFGYITFADDRQSISGAEGAPALSTALIAPHIEVNTGFVEINYFDTSIAIVNPGGSPASVTMQLHGLDGALRGSSTMNVPARGSREVSIAETFATSMPSNGLGGRTFSGYLRLNSDNGVAVWQRVEGILARSMLRAKPIAELRTTQEAYVPHFADGGSNLYGSFLNLINTSTSSVELELSAHSDRGTPIGETVRMSLGPGQGRREHVMSLFRVVTPAIFPPFLVTGAIRIRRVDGGAFQAAGNVEIFNSTLETRDASMLYPIVDAAATSWTLPFASSAGPYFTGYVIQNANSMLTVQTDVVVEFVASNGTVLERTPLQLSPGTRSANVVGLSNPGYIRITSNFPVYVSGAIGTRNHHMLEQVPALR